MAIVTAAIPIKIPAFKRANSVGSTSKPYNFGIVKRQSSVILVALNKSSFKVIYTKPSSFILNKQGLKVLSTKPLLTTYLKKTTGTGTGETEPYGRTGQVYPTGFN